MENLGQNMHRLDLYGSLCCLLRIPISALSEQKYPNSVDNIL